MKFTKEYIKECDCPEIQGLRFPLEIGDWFIDEDSDVLLVAQYDGYKYWSFGTDKVPLVTYPESKVIWLPTGDQLTDLIFKHCHTYNLDITLYHEHHCRDCSKCCIAMEANYANGHLIEKEIDIEAREYEIKLAKIKLLKQLLEEEMKNIGIF